MTRLLEKQVIRSSWCSPSSWTSIWCEGSGVCCNRLLSPSEVGQCPICRWLASCRGS